MQKVRYCKVNILYIMIRMQGLKWRMRAVYIHCYSDVVYVQSSPKCGPWRAADHLRGDRGVTAQPSIPIRPSQ
jgi:hypothetical protein